MDNMGKISMLPSVASEALAVSNDSECTAEQLCAIVRRDVTLATDMLTLANSPMFSVDKPVANLQQAIVRLGFKQCRSLIVSSSTMSLMKKMPLSEEWVREVLWNHSFKTATMCSLLNRSLALDFTGEEFAAGLLHDFGRLLLAVAAEDRFAEADSMDFDESDELFLEHEQSVLGTDHCQFGAWFAEKSGLPQNLIETIRFHHDPAFNTPNKDLVALVAAADHFVNFLNQPPATSAYLPETNQGLIQICKYYGTDVIEKFSSDMDTIVDEFYATT